MPRCSNDVDCLLFWCFLSFNSTRGKWLKIETRMQTQTSLKQHFITGMNYLNRRLIIIRGNKRSGKMFAFDDTPTRSYSRHYVNGESFVLKLLNLVCICRKPVCNWGQICHSATCRRLSVTPELSRKKKLACSRRSDSWERRKSSRMHEWVASDQGKRGDSRSLAMSFILATTFSARHNWTPATGWKSWSHEVTAGKI